MNTYRHNTLYYNYRHNIDLSARRLLPAIHLYSVMMGWRVGGERGVGEGEGGRVVPVVLVVLHIELIRPTVKLV